MRMVCQECHSEDVQINAWCDWSTEAQEWVPNLASDSPAAPFCQVCCQHTEVINMPDKQHGATNMNYSKPPAKFEPPSIFQYQRDDESWVIHVDTNIIPENELGPLVTVYLNDDLDHPLWDNQEQPT